MVSGSISLPLPGFFSPFLHSTGSLSVATEYLALDRGRPGFRQGSSCPAVLRYRIMETDIFRVRGFHSLWQAFPSPSTIYLFSLNSTGHPHAALQPPLNGFGLFRFRSPLLSESPEDRSSSWFLFLELLRWFSSLSLALLDYFIHLL